MTRQKLRIFGLGVCSGLAIYYLNKYYAPVAEVVHASWTNSYEPSTFAKWNYDWDHRNPENLVKRAKSDDPIDQNEYNEQLEKVKPTATRHILLIRHGQYNLDGKTDRARFLTQLGRKQAEYTGQRLKELDLPYTKVIKSTMTRAQETGDIILKSLKMDAEKVRNCSLIEEGAPIPPEPPVGHWKPERYQFYTEGARIEAAFRRYIHRASPEQKEDSYTVIVCHANVIRYFVCRALQFPPEAWLRLSLKHGSITYLSVTPKGRVILRQLGDSGHIPAEYLSSK